MVWASQPTPAPQCGVVDSSSCGAADGATRITPDAVCIPKRSQPREGEGRRALEGYPRPARARAIGSTPATDADRSRRRHPHGHSGGKAPAGSASEVGGGGDAVESFEPPADGPLGPLSQTQQPCARHEGVLPAMQREPAGGGRATV